MKIWKKIKIIKIIIIKFPINKITSTNLNPPLEILFKKFVNKKQEIKWIKIEKYWNLYWKVLKKLMII